MNNPYLEKVLSANVPTSTDQLAACAEEQAKAWLCRRSDEKFPPADFATWRIHAYLISANSFRNTVEAEELQRVWESAFDYTVRESTGIENPSITRAEVLEDIWTSAGLQTPAGYLARRGDIVNVQPAPFAHCPVTVMPRKGTIFCTQPEKIREIETISLAGFIEPFSPPSDE